MKLLILGLRSDYLGDKKHLNHAIFVNFLAIKIEKLAKEGAMSKTI